MFARLPAKKAMPLSLLFTTLSIYFVCLASAGYSYAVEGMMLALTILWIVFGAVLLLKLLQQTGATNEFKVDVHHWLILHSRYVCSARKPKCGNCLIKDLCEFKEKSE